MSEEATSPNQDTQAPEIQITDKAREMIASIMEQEDRSRDALRVTAHRGGPAGVTYGLAFATPEEIEEHDLVLESGGIRLVLDPASRELLDGATVDYIEGQWESGFKIDGPQPEEPKPEGPVAEAVMRIIDERINPGIAAHGGYVQLIDIKDDTAYVRLGGGCQGCGMVDVTLKHGIEAMIVEQVPEIQKVLDTTDHAAGTNPYYAPAKSP